MSFDDHIKNKLKRYETPVDTDALWESVSSEMEEKKKDRRWTVLFFFLGSLIIASGGWLGLQGIGTYLGERTAEFYEVPVQTEDENTTRIKATDSGLAQNTSLVNEQSSLGLRSSEAISEAIVNNTATAASKKKPQTQTSIVLPEKQPIQAASPVHIAPSSIPKENKTPIKPVILETKENSKDEKLDEPQEEPLFPIATIIRFIPVEEEGNVLAEVDSEEESKDGKDKNPKEKAEVKMYVGMHSTGFKNFRTLTPTNGRSFVHQVKRNDSEISLISWEHGVDFGLITKDGFSVRTGITRTTIRERFEKLSYPGETAAALPIGPGNPTQVEPLPKINTYKIYDIPVLVGFEKSKGKFGYGMMTGAYMNLMVNADGRMYDRSRFHRIIDFDNEEEELIRDNIIVSFYGEFYMNYDLSSNVALTAGAAVKYNAESMTRLETGLKQHHLLTGLRLGLRYNL